MKKIFTLFFAAGMITLAQAQPGNRDNRQPDRRDNPIDQRDNQPTDQRDQNNWYGDERDVVVNHNPYNKDDDRFDNNDFRYGNNRFANERRMKMQIAQIKREYDYKIEKVMYSFFISRWEKQRQIRFLQEQRQREISKVYFKFNGQGNRYDEHDNCDHRY